MVWFDRQFRSGEKQGKLYLLRVGRMFHHDKGENQRYLQAVSNAVFMPWC